MKPSPASPHPQPGQALACALKPVLDTVALDGHMDTVKAAAAALGADAWQCAAALLHLMQAGAPPPRPARPALPPLKMVRYRLEVGSEHHLTVERLKKVLAEESGVDKNHIANISIRADHTLIDLPDAMPQDIYQHLRTVEINQRPLAIRRVKARKKRHAPRPPANTGTGTAPATPAAPSAPNRPANA